MTPYLLLGAGFSRNWGGWLASEAFEYLLGRPELAENESLRRLLWKHRSRGGFEDALADLQSVAGRGEPQAVGDLSTLKAAVTAMFDDMNAGYERRTSWEFSKDLACSVSKFLTQFEAIFTLNQDLLVEHFYLSNQPELLRSDRWIGASMPGIGAGSTTASITGRKWRVLEQGAFKLEERIQPYFKLHGSSNWLAPDGSNTLIIGGNKLQAIVGAPVLKWYQDEFEARLCSGDARLMVIGYGFRDEHINALLIKAVQDHGLRLFIVSPEGAGQARAANPTAQAAIYAPTPLEAAFETGVIGASQRGLGEIFSANGNELQKLYRFLTP